MTDPQNAELVVRLEAALEPLASLGLPRVETSPRLQHLNTPFWDCPDDLVLYNDNMGSAIIVGDVRRAYALLIELRARAVHS